MAGRAPAGRVFPVKIIPSLILVLFLSACETPLISDLVTSQGQVLYQDDFSDPMSGFSQTTNSNGTLGYWDGTYHMLVVTPGYDLWAVSGHAYGNVRVEVDATRLAGPLVNRFGLICHYQDMKNYYFFIISSDGYYAIGKIKNGESTLLGQTMMGFSSAILQTGGANHLGFECNGSSLKGLVNDQPVAVASDPDLSGGDVGLIAGTFTEGGVEISFDNFVVVKP